MCRWFVYYGDKENIINLLFIPKNSLIKQSYKKPYSPMLKEFNIRDHQVNVDGFGIGWYFNDNIEPCKFLSIKPPWNDVNFYNLSKCISTNLLFGHIRAIKPFSKSIVHEYNCHPFSHKNFLFMHNGDISNFSFLKKKLVTYLKDDIYLNLKGNTDSEFCFAIFLNLLKSNKYNNGGYLQPYYFKKLILRTIKKILSLSLNQNKDAINSLNFAVTDGQTIICTRYLNIDNEPPSLYYCITDDNVSISSEPIHFNDKNYKLLDKNNIILIKKNKKIEISNIKI